MTHRPSRLFPILLIVLLGGLTFWLDTITDWLGAYVNVGINISDNYRGRPEDYWSTATSVRPNWYSGLLPISMMDANNSALQQMIAAQIIVFRHAHAFAIKLCHI